MALLLLNERHHLIDFISSVTMGSTSSHAWYDKMLSVTIASVIMPLVNRGIIGESQTRGNARGLITKISVITKPLL
ncbi:hypothetical protein P4S52_00060 [Vibrio sp. SA48]